MRRKPSQPFSCDDHPYVILGETEKKKKLTTNMETFFLPIRSVHIELFFPAMEYKHGGLKSCFCSNHEVMLLIEYKLEPTGISE